MEEQISVKCPECRSTNIIRTDYFNSDDGLFGNRLYEQYKCLNCGNFFIIPA